MSRIPFWVRAMACAALVALPLHRLRAEQPIRAVIIGTDTSHAVAFAKLINDPKAVGALGKVEVVAAFPGGSVDIPSSRDRVQGYAEQLRASGIEIAASIDDAVERADAFLLESVDGRVHLEQFRRIASGKPVFVDKPAAASTADFIEMTMIAEETKTPFFSSSALRYGAEVRRILGDNSVGKVLGASTSTPFHVEPHHPDLFWYGIHGVEALSAILGPGCETVVRRDSTACALVIGQWPDGKQGCVWALKTPGAVYSCTRYGVQGVASATGFSGYENLVDEICQFFVTRKSPVALAETIEILAIMEASDESVARGGTTTAVAEVIERARREVELRRAARK